MKYRHSGILSSLASHTPAERGIPAAPEVPSDAKALRAYLARAHALPAFADTVVDSWWWWW